MLDRKSSLMTGVARNITQNILQKSRIHSSISNDIEKQLTLIHKCPTLPASKLFNGFLMSAQRAPHGIKNIVKQNRLGFYICFISCFQVLTERSNLTSTLSTIRCKDEKWKLMYVFDLVTRCTTTENCYKLVRLSIREQLCTDDGRHTVFIEVIVTTLWSMKSSRWAVSLKLNQHEKLSPMVEFNMF